MTEETITPPDQEPPNYRTILIAYAWQWVALLSSFIPSVAGCIISIVLLIFATAHCARVRKKVAEDSLAANHMTFLIRTVGLGSTFALFTVGLASAYMIKVQDVTPLNACFQKILDGGGNDVSYDMLKPCMDDYMTVNHHMILVSGIVSIVPILVYFLYRFTMGLARALKGYRIKNEKSWF